MGTYSCVSRALVPLPKLTEPSFLLFSQIRELFNFGLVESVDNRVLTRDNMYALDLRRIRMTIEAEYESDFESAHTNLLFLNPTWPTAMLPSFFRFDHGV